MPGSIITSGSRVALCTVEPEDAEFLQRAYTRPELREPLGRKPRPIARVEREIVENSKNEDFQQFLLCVESEQSDEAESDELTRVGLFTARQVQKRPNIAIWLDEAYQGEGYGKEAATLAIETIFTTYDVPSIGAGVYEFNQASQALLEALGFEREGRQRKYKFHDGQYYDNLKYGILREEWNERDERSRE